MARTRVSNAHFDSGQIVHEIPYPNRHPAHKSRRLSFGSSTRCTSIWDEGFVFQVAELEVVRRWFMTIHHWREYEIDRTRANKQKLLKYNAANTQTGLLCRNYMQCQDGEEAEK